MEDVLELYAEPYDAERPVLCLDESPVQLLGDLRAPLPMQPATPTNSDGKPDGKPLREDYQYERRGMANLFMAFEPLAAWRDVRVTERRTKQDFAEYLKALLDGRYAEVKTLRLVTDNLNTHNPTSLYETFSPAEARRLLKRIEWHYTPKHGSWLNMVEIELGVLSRQCLRRRIPDRETLRQESAAWSADRNREGATVKWRFTTTDARHKLGRLYPSHSA